MDLPRDKQFKEVSITVKESMYKSPHWELNVTCWVGR